MRTLGLAVVLSALLAGCGRSSRTLADGHWYGRLVSVVPQRRLEFAPACVMRSNRWVAGGGEARFMVTLAAHAALFIYYRRAATWLTEMVRASI